MAEDSADKTIQAARAVQRHPVLFGAIADGRLHLSAVNLLAPHLTPESADELVAAASGLSCARIRELFAERERVRGPQSTDDLLAQVVANPRCEPDSNQVMFSAGHVNSVEEVVAPTPAAPAPKPRVIQFTVPAELADAYREALALAPYDVAHDSAKAFAHMLTAWREKLEKQHFGVAPRPGRRGGGAGRHVTKDVARAVWQRDGGRCTYVSDAGKRCECRAQLELDHVTPIARGGNSTADNLRLRCRAHNQLEAERAFGKGFMAAKRAQARAHADVRRERCAREANIVALPEPEANDDVRRALKNLGFSVAETRDAVARSEAAISDATVEEKLRYALKSLAPRGRHPAA
jgi:hypothetical protein